MTTPADELRAAAVRLRGYAKAAALASPGAWTITPEQVIRCGNGEGVIVADRSCADPGEDADLPYIALMHPGVGQTIAQWLDAEWRRLNHSVHPDWQDVAAHHALAVARAINGDAR